MNSYYFFWKGSHYTLSVFNNAIVFCLVVIFFVSGISKMIYLKSFIRLVISFQILPPAIAKFCGLILPFIELSGSLLLLSNQYFFYGIFLLVSLLISFLYVVISVLKTQKSVSCGCYGIFLESTVDLFTLSKIIILLLFLLIALGSKHSYLNTFSPWSLIIGIFLCLLIFICQKIWNVHQEVMGILRSTNRR